MPQAREIEKVDLGRLVEAEYTEAGIQAEVGVEELEGLWRGRGKIRGRDRGMEMEGSGQGQSGRWDEG